MKRPTIVAVLMAFITACSAPPGRPDEQGTADSSQRYGVVDLERVLSETAAGRRASSQIADLEQQAQAQLEQIREALEARASEISDAQAEGIEEEEFQTMVAEYQQMVQQAQQVQGVLQQQVEQARQQITQPLLEDTARVARNIGRDEGYALILEMKAVPYIVETSDLTDQIIEELERQGGSFSNEASTLLQGEGAAPEPAVEDEPESAED